MGLATGGLIHPVRLFLSTRIYSRCALPTLWRLRGDIWRCLLWRQLTSRKRLWHCMPYCSERYDSANMLYAPESV